MAHGNIKIVAKNESESECLNIVIEMAWFCVTIIVVKLKTKIETIH